MRCCMRAFRRSRTTRQASALTTSLLVGALMVAAGAGPAAAGPAAGLKQVLYQGYTFDVPASWPVIDEALHPRTCVRFDEHAVYLGGPGPDQSCPSWLFGTTESVVIQTGPASARRSATENPVSRQITATAPRVRISATFDRDPNVIYTMLSRADLPAPQIVLPNPALLDAAEGTSAAGPPAAGRAASPAPAGPGRAVVLTATASRLARQAGPTPARAVPVRRPALPADVANFRGLGFDSCAAPSASYMRQWRRHSPYRAVGIYIGGSDRACDQSNLTAGWVRRQASAGWKFFPMYAGPQAAFGELSQPGRPGGQGRRGRRRAGPAPGLRPAHADLLRHGGIPGPGDRGGTSIPFCLDRGAAPAELPVGRLQQFPVRNHRPVPAIRARRLCHARCHL